MEMWRNHELTLTVGKTLKLEALAKKKQVPELDIIGNPVLAITALRRPGIVVELFGVIAGEPLPVDGMTGPDFTELRGFLERVILDFFRDEPETLDLLTRILELEGETRSAMNQTAILETRKDIERMRNPPEPPGGTSSGSLSDEPDSNPGILPFISSTEPQQQQSEHAGTTQPA